MFERYTESARRALFFARQETTELHGVSIETEHRLLGLLREDKGVSSTLFARAHVWYEPVRAKVPRGPGEKVPASVEIPLSAETERVLQHADEESSRLGHSYLGTEHVLLGLLREEQSLAVRHGARGGPRTTVAGARGAGDAVRCRDCDFDRHLRLERIKALIAGLEQTEPGSSEARELVEVIRQALDTL
jgi:ATP-dependent Clp protease ATP-binding subunit ClpA